MVMRQFIAAVFLLAQLAGGLVAPHGAVALAGEALPQMTDTVSSGTPHAASPVAGHCADQNAAADVHSDLHDTSNETSHDSCETGCDSCVACVAGLSGVVRAGAFPQPAPYDAVYTRAPATGVATALLRPPAQA